MAGVSQESGRAGTVHAVVAHRTHRCLFDLGMRRQAEIVLRREIDALYLFAAIRLGRAMRLRRAGSRPRIRPQIVLPAQILPFEEAGDALQQIGARRRFEIAQAAIQRSLGNTPLRIFFAVLVHQTPRLAPGRFSTLCEGATMHVLLEYALKPIGIFSVTNRAEYAVNSVTLWKSSQERSSNANRLGQNPGNWPLSERFCEVSPGKIIQP